MGKFDLTPEQYAQIKQFGDAYLADTFQNTGRPPIGTEDTQLTDTRDTTRPPVYWATADSFAVVNPVQEERKKKIINILVSVATAIAVYMLLTKFATKKLKN
jgi:hypothetical protein